MTTLGDASFLAQTEGCNPRIHPNGFIQLDLEPMPSWEDGKQRGHSGASKRMHIWNPPGVILPRQLTVNEIHDHVFDMRSTVLIGTLEQRLFKFEMTPPAIAHFPPDSTAAISHWTPTHEKYQAVYDQKGSRLEATGERGWLKLVNSFKIDKGNSYTQKAFTLHDSNPGDDLVVTFMEKVEVYEGIPTVICKSGSPPDNSFDRAEAAHEKDLWRAIWRSLGIESCPYCLAPKMKWEKRDFSHVYVDYDWYCTVCHHYIRPSSH